MDGATSVMKKSISNTISQTPRPFPFKYLSDIYLDRHQQMSRTNSLTLLVALREKFVSRGFFLSSQTLLL